MILWFRFSLRCCSVQKIIFLLFYRPVVRACGIIALHFDAFRGGEMRKVTDKVNQVPTILGASMLAAIGKCWHSREPHAILDDPEKLAVGKILRFRQTHIRRFGVEAIANRRLPAAVVAMTDGAMIREMKPRVAQILRRGEQAALGHTRIRRY